MDERLAEYIAVKLKELGYKNIESNCGTVWYEDADGNIWSLCPQLCEPDGITKADHALLDAQRAAEDLSDELALERGLL